MNITKEIKLTNETGSIKLTPEQIERFIRSLWATDQISFEYVTKTGNYKKLKHLDTNSGPHNIYCVFRRGCDQ